ncbi:MAG: MMPL family transporter [Halioglobus sp.]|nr:MMPL family transporter [Halioglobus sp.]
MNTQSKSIFHRALHRFDDLVFGSPRAVLVLILLVTAFFATRIPGVRMYSDFADLLPQLHPYIQLHNQIRDSFGGANNIILSVEVKEGDIFDEDVIRRIDRITQKIDQLPGVNHNTVASITHRTVRKVWLTETGDVNSAPYFDSLKSHWSDAELAQMREDVRANPRVYGLLVSPDLKAALIKATFNEGALDYQAIFAEVRRIREQESDASVNLYVTGQPMLVGWVYTYVDQILQVFVYTALILVSLLILYFRRLYGILLPLCGILLATTWGLGTISLLGFNLDPLTLVVPFLISARAMSHGVQLVQRYYLEFDRVGVGRQAARSTFDSLFRPGSLGVVSDAVGLLLIALGSVPINTKMAYYASLWAAAVIPTVLVFIPVALSLLPQPKKRLQAAAGERRGLLAVLPDISAVVSSRRRATAILLLMGGLAAVGLYFSSWVQIGESEPGSPILYPQHDYNRSSKAINDLFPGSEELFIVARTDEPDGIKRPEVLNALERFQRHMLNDPELGGAKLVTDLVKQVNRIFHSNDPRWAQIPDTAAYVGGLLFAYEASSPVPGASREFLDTDSQNANLVFFYKDHRGGTIRRAIHQAKAWINDPENRVQGLQILLAGGSIGVTAAINEASFATNLLVIPLVLALIFVFVTAFYWSFSAGALMMLAMTFATTLTYAYMGIQGIGINVNTVPIIAVGIGVGIDYSIYIMDRIREESARGVGLDAAIANTLASTGLAVGFTAASLIGGVVMWYFLSDLRFQADAALLLCVMLVLNAAAAVFLVPAWIRVFQPKFIVSVHYDEDGILVTDDEPVPGIAAG